MRNLTFRGYAQNKGFDPLRIPDQTLKLQQETERTLSGMREVRNQNQQNRSEQLQAIKDVNAKEADQRSKNQKSKLYFEQEYVNALAANNRQKIINLGVEGQNAQRKQDEWKRLAELVPQAITAYSDLDEVRLKTLAERGAMKVKDMPSAIQNNIDRLLSASFEHSLEFNIMRNNVPDFDEHWHTLSRMKPYERYGAVAVQIKDFFKNGGATAQYNQLSNSKTLVNPNGENTAAILAKPNRISNNEAFASLDVIRSEMLKPYQQLGDAVYQKIVLPEFDKFFGQLKMEIGQEVVQNRKRVASEIKDKEFKIYVNTPPTIIEGIRNYIYSNGTKPGVVAAQINFMDQRITSLFESGEWDRSNWNELMSGEMELDNGKIINPVEYWKGRSSGWKRALNKREAMDREARENELLGIKQQMITQRFQFMETNGRDYNDTELVQWVDNVFKLNNITDEERKKHFEFVNTFGNREPRDIADDRETLTVLADSGRLSRTDLAKVNPSLWPEFIEKIKAGEKLTKTQKSNGAMILRQTIKKIGGTISTDEKFLNADNQAMYNKSYNNVFGNALTEALINFKDVAPTDVLEKLIQVEKKKIETGEGIYARHEENGVQVIGKDGKWLFATDATGFRQSQEYSNKVKENATWLNQPGAINTPDLKKLVKYVNGDKANKPYFLRTLAEADTTRSEYEVTRDILKAEYDYDLKPTGAEHMIHYLEEKDRKHLRNKPSMSKTCQLFDVNPENHACLAQMEMPLEVYYNSVNPYAAVQGSNISGGISSLQDYFGTDETQITIGALINLGNKNMGTKFGAYGFSTQDLERAVNQGIVSTEDAFSPETQTALKGEFMYDETSVFYANDYHFQPIPGVGKYFGESEDTGDIDLPTAEILLAYLNLDLEKIHPVMYDHLKKLGDKYKLWEKQVTSKRKS